MLKKNLAGVLLATITTIGLVGCGSDSNDDNKTPAQKPDTSGPVEPKPDQKPDPVAPQPDPRYMVLGANPHPANPTAFVPYGAVVADISDKTTVNLKNALIGDYASSGYDLERKNTIFLGSQLKPVITKVTINESGQLEKGDVMSLRNAGMTTGQGSAFYFINKTKAYFIDVKEYKSVTWNPEALTFDQASIVSFDGLKTGIPGTDAKASIRDHKRVGDNVFIFARYQNSNGSFQKFGKVAVLNLKTNKVTYASQNQCGHLQGIAATDAGDVYFSSHSALASSERAGLTTDKPCMVRIKAGSTTFDPNYYVDLKALTGSEAGFLVQGPKNNGYLVVRDKTAGDIAKSDAAVTAAQKSAKWYWHEIDLSVDTETPKLTKLNLDPTIAYGTTSVAEVGKERTKTTFLASVGKDGTTFINLTSGSKMLKSPGHGFYILRVN